MTHAIILCAGKINYSTLPIISSNDNALVPINGKPVIGWIIDDMIRRKLTISLVVKKKQVALIKYVKKMYANKIIVDIIIAKGKTILTSLSAGLEKMEKKNEILIVLGDTLIRDDIGSNESSFVYIGEVDESSRWCTVEYDKNSLITKLHDKEDDDLISSKYALAGYYYITDSLKFKQSVEQALLLNGTELSEALRIYGSYEPLKVKLAREWYDFGNIDKLLEAKRELIQSRYFNKTVVNPNNNSITKTSENTKKLSDEINWYKKLPEELEHLVPRIFSMNSASNPSITQEYYGYPTLAELYLYSELNIESWRVILKKVVNTHKIFRSYESKCKKKDMEMMYITKTLDRIRDVKNIDNIITKLFEYDYIMFNGKDISNFHILEKRVRKYTQDMIPRVYGSIIHGDFCFSNILFDYNNLIIKLIDPRGSFGRKGIYGDARYDIAKLRHSIHGMYDFIIAGMFNLEITGNNISGTVFQNNLTKDMTKILDDYILKFGYNLNDIKFIEGLLFISMIPLHLDDSNKQIMFYLRGLELLNEVLA